MFEAASEARKGVMMNSQHFLLNGFVCFVILVLPAAAAECPDCPGDLNGDGRVDFRDLSIMTQNWLAECSQPTSLPLLQVIEPGITEDQLGKLAEHLGLNPELVGFEDGAAIFVDPMNLQSVPTLPVEDEELIRELREGSEVEPGGQLQFERLNRDALAGIKPLPAEEVLDEVLIGLNRAGVELGQAEAQTDHTLFEMVDTEGKLLLPAVQLDTRINFQMYASGVPIVGPGSQVSLTVDPQGQATHMAMANRSVSPADEVGLMTPDEAAAKASAALGGRFLPEGDIKLVYYAPPLSKTKVQLLVPHYDIGGILYGEEGQQANKLRKLVPATTDRRVVPQVDLSAVARGNLVQAEADVAGGAPPYQFEWFSSSAPPNTIPQGQSQTEYNAFPREQAGEEVVTVKVTDENGIVVEASAVLQIGFVQLQQPAGGVTILKGGVRDFGVERAVSDLCAANQAGFISRFLADNVEMRFNWTGTSAWEQDFKQPPAGTDTTYVDNADIVFYCGHGYGGGFTFESEFDDKYLTYSNAAGAWGNLDLEWLSLLSCQVLKDTYDGKKWWTRWGPAFDGLHLLTGFQTNAYDWPNFGPRYADWMLGRNLGFTNIKLPVRCAWFMAKKQEQPSSVQAVVMGVVGPGNVLGGYNDYFWGKGPVSADLRGSNIKAYWRLVYQ